MSIADRPAIRPQFKSEDKVTWWKRAPGGKKVYPIPAVVFNVTAKRIKIVADVKGGIAIRYVRPESLEKRK